MSEIPADEREFLDAISVRIVTLRVSASDGGSCA
jgi:hypothetical protein